MGPFARFLAAVAIVCAGGYLALHLVARSPAYCRHTRAYADTASCYHDDVAGRRVDVLFAGDSALLHAVRPALVRQATGLTSYNYGLLGPAFAFDPAAVVDGWLARNPAPRAIVLYVSPWDEVDPGTLHDPGWFPLALRVAQHDDLAQFARLVRARPAVLAEIPPVIASSLGFGTAAAARNRAGMEADDGHLAFSPPGSPPLPTAADECRRGVTPIPPVLDGRMEAALAALRARYRARGIAVFVYVAPVAACDRALPLIRRRWAGIADNLPAELPDGMFVANAPPEAKHVHVNAAGEAPASALAARFVAAKLGVPAR